MIRSDICNFLLTLLKSGLTLSLFSLSRKTRETTCWTWKSYYQPGLLTNSVRETHPLTLDTGSGISCDWEIPSKGLNNYIFLCLSWLPYSYIQLSLNISMALSHRCLKPLQTLLDLLGILIFLDDLYRPFGVVMDYFLSLLLISNLNNNVSVLPALLFTCPALPFLASSQARINVTAQQLFFLFPILLPSNSFFKFITY